MTEKEIIKRVDEMCAQSLDPEHGANWGEIKYWLEQTRHRLKDDYKGDN